MKIIDYGALESRDLRLLSKHGSKPVLIVLMPRVNLRKIT